MLRRTTRLMLSYHSERLVIAFALIASAPGMPIRIIKTSGCEKIVTRAQSLSLGCMAERSS
uniref:DYW domain-containing protein n=1 Tax=Arundo donax TaxID=35708 RepID=A0A0A9F8H7_ARUDO